MERAGIWKYSYSLDKERTKTERKTYTYGESLEGIECCDYVLFGEYPFEENGDKKPIEWIVMEIDYDNDMLFLISRYVIDVMPYHSGNKKIQWNNSDVRKWLNTDFINTAFSTEDSENIIPTRIPYTAYQRFTYKPIKQDSLCIDKVFLLSFAQQREFWPTIDNLREHSARGSRIIGAVPYEKRMTELTPYAKTKEYISPNAPEREPIYNYILRDNIENEIGCVLKQYAENRNHGKGILETGYYSHSNAIPDGIRPAMWVKK